MNIEIIGPMAYDLRKGYPNPLTDSQADFFIAEYAKIGLLFMKGKWNEEICIYARARARDYISFNTQFWKCQQDIRERAGNGISILCNSYQPGKTYFSPPNDWNQIVNYIDKNFIEKEYKEYKSKSWWKIF